MKTFEQFLSEANRPAFGSQRDIKGAEKYLQSPEAGQTREHPVIARRRAREEAQRTGPRGTSISRAQQEIARQLAAQKAAREAEIEKQNTLAQAAERLAQRTPEEIALAEKRKKAIERSKKRAEKKAAQQTTPEA